MRKLVLVMGLTVALAGCARKDALEIPTGSDVSVQKHDGVSVTGKLVEVKADQIVVETRDGTKIQVPRSQIATLRSLTTEPAKPRPVRGRRRNHGDARRAPKRRKGPSPSLVDEDPRPQAGVPRSHGAGGNDAFAGAHERRFVRHQQGGRSRARHAAQQRERRRRSGAAGGNGGARPRDERRALGEGQGSRLDRRSASIRSICRATVDASRSAPGRSPASRPQRRRRTRRRSAWAPAPAR